MNLSQVRAIALNEFRMHWRERGLIVLMLAILVLNIFTALIFRSNSELLPGDQIRLSTQMVALGWVPLCVTLIFILPVVIADTIPQDHQLGTGEILRATPLAPGTYLLGKLVGMWISTLAGLVVVLSITAGLWLVLVQHVNWPLFLEVSLLGVTALVLINGSLGVLLPVSQPTRRKAVLLAIGLFFVLPLIMGINNSASVFYYLNPARFPIIMYYSYIPAPQPEFTFQMVLIALGAGLAEVIVVWVAAWVYLRKREELV